MTSVKTYATIRDGIVASTNTELVDLLSTILEDYATQNKPVSVMVLMEAIKRISALDADPVMH